MRRKLFSILTAVVVLSITVSPAFAQSIRITLSGFRLGSLIADGKVRLAHTYPENTTVTLRAAGLADVTCKSEYHTWVVKNVRVQAIGSSKIWASQFDGKGRASFSVETGTPKPISHYVCGKARIKSVGFVFWDEATISAKTAVTGLETRQDFRCETSTGCVTCRRVKDNDKDRDDEKERDRERDK